MCYFRSTIPFCAIAAISASAPAGSVPFEQQVIDWSQIAYQRVVADIDGDNRNDVIAVTDTHIRWFRAPGFSAQNILQLNISQHGFERFRADDFVAADIDDDGDPDLVTRVGDNGTANGNVVWFENPMPDGSVTGNWPVHIIGANAYVKDIAIADFDNDDKLDVVTRGHTNTQIWFQNGADNWSKTSFNHAALEGMDVGDLDGDGDPDIVLNGFWMRTPSNPRNGTYQQFNIDQQWYNQGSEWPNNCCRVVVADIDGNQKPDVVLSHSEKAGYPVAWYSASNPTGAWQQHTITNELAFCHTLRAADFDDDDDIDVLAGGMPQSSQRGLRLFRQQGAGWSMELIQQDGSYSAEIGDLHEDGDIDIVDVRNWDSAPTEIWVNTLLDSGGPAGCEGDIVSTDTFQPPPDGLVDGADLAYLLGAWGSNPASPADFVSSQSFQPPPDGLVDGADLAVLLGAWGPCD